MSQVDNRFFAAKLDLRRHFLRTFHADDPPRVLDCCAGESRLWTELRREFDVGSYWGVDLKRKKGRVKVDSVRILSQPGWDQNVIDVDTYGPPWKHWQALLPHVTRPLSVFLTVGAAGNMRILSRAEAAAMRLGPIFDAMPRTMGAILHALSLDYQLASLPAGVRISAIVEAECATRHQNQTTRYLGVRLIPQTLE